MVGMGRLLYSWCAATLALLVVLWIFGPDGSVVWWLERGFAGAGILLFLWLLVFRAGPDD
jgi:hypothetical protein